MLISSPLETESLYYIKYDINIKKQHEIFEYRKRVGREIESGLCEAGGGDGIFDERIKDPGFLNQILNYKL